MKLFRKSISLLFILTLIFTFSVTAYAQDIVPFSSDGKIISVAHGGNTMEFPENSLSAIKSAFEKGADCVSVSVIKTTDGVFVLSRSDELGVITSEGRGMLISKVSFEQISSFHLKDKAGSASQETVTELSTVLKTAAAYDKTVIIDCDRADKEAVYDIIRECDAENNALIRTTESAKEIALFNEKTNSSVGVIGQYHGNILFTARSYIKSLSAQGCKMIFLGTKNWFGEIFRTPVLSAFSQSGYTARAAMKTYDTKESGLRPDSENTWNDLIDRGYSVIETDRIEDLLSYIAKLENERASLSDLVNEAKSVDSTLLTIQSSGNIESAVKNAEKALTTISSAQTLSLAKSALNNALSGKVFIDSPESSDAGVFSVTPGKIIAIILVTAAILVVQIYFYYRQADKKLPQWLRKLLHK